MKKAYAVLVAATVGAHFGYLLYLPSGGFLALRWPRSTALHIPAVLWGAAVVWLGLPCPLTRLEQWARARAGLAPLPAGGFIARYVAGVVYPVGATPTAQHLAFGTAALSLLVLLRQRGGPRLATAGPPRPARNRSRRAVLR